MNRDLKPEDVLRRGDETNCRSTQHWEPWIALDGDWSDYLGRTVEWATSRERADVDARERIFRRRIETP